MAWWYFFYASFPSLYWLVNNKYCIMANCLHLLFNAHIDTKSASHGFWKRIPLVLKQEQLQLLISQVWVIYLAWFWWFLFLGNALKIHTLSSPISRWFFVKSSMYNYFWDLFKKRWGSKAPPMGQILPFATATWTNSFKGFLGSSRYFSKNWCS